jgi:hypothetical protein
MPSKIHKLLQYNMQDKVISLKPHLTLNYLKVVIKVLP